MRQYASVAAPAGLLKALRGCNRSVILHPDTGELQASEQCYTRIPGWSELSMPEGMQRRPQGPTKGLLCSYASYLRISRTLLRSVRASVAEGRNLRRVAAR